MQFTATGDDPDGPEDDLLYSWDFGDGLTSFQQSPSHTYMEPGVYQAKVTVQDGSGATATKVVTITVTDPVGNVAPVVEGTFLIPGPDPMLVEFSAQGTDPDGDALTYEWDFDDGSAKATGSKVQHKYTSAGTYNATVTAFDGHDGKHTATVKVTLTQAVNQPPVVKVAADPKTGSAPLTVQFSSQVSDPEGKGMSFVWAFGDGGQSADANPIHTYTAPGTYTATLTVRDAGGATSSASVEIVVAAAQATRRPARPTMPRRSLRPRSPGSASPSRRRPRSPRSPRSGLAVSVTCTQAMRGSATITVSKRVAKALGLKKTTLATGALNCAAGGKSVTLKPSAAVKRALKKAKGSVKVTLNVRLRAAGEPSTRSKRTLTLSRR